MRLIPRLRSASDAPPTPAYLLASQQVARTSSAPDLLSALGPEESRDADAGSILSALALEEQHRLQAGFVGGATPPKYSHLVPTSPRFPVFPRDEEGAETLPRYRPSVEMSGTLSRKLELVSPFDSAPRRAWHNVFVVLDNTQLKLYNPRTCELVRVYTLQYAEVGLATDYAKRPFTLRIRAECEQFLLSCIDDDDCVRWANGIQMGISLALPLDERTLPKYRSIPRRRRYQTTSNGRNRNRSGNHVEARWWETALRASPAVSAAESRRRIEQIVNRVTARDAPSLDPASHIEEPSAETWEAATRPARSVASTESDEDAPPPPPATDLGEPPHIPAASAHGDLPASSAASMADSLLPMPPTIPAARTASASPRTAAAADDAAETDGEYDEEDADLNRTADEQQHIAERISGDSYRNAIKWQPDPICQSPQQAARYATRCIASLTRDASWQNKTIIVQGLKCVVRSTSLEVVPSTLLF